MVVGGDKMYKKRFFPRAGKKRAFKRVGGRKIRKKRGFSNRRYRSTRGGVRL